MVKEMRVMESVPRKCELNFEPFFGKYDDVVHSSIGPNPAMAKLIHKRINGWISDLGSSVLFPKIGSKTVSKASSAELYNLYPGYIRTSDIGITPVDLERVYHSTGTKVTGPCQMRQKWYANQLKPRTYYAAGGTAIHSSYHLAKPFVELCDILPITHRMSRVLPSRIVIPEDDLDVIYYDLVSFTSNLHVQRVFMYRLAHYCRGYEVSILDSCYGIIKTDLGQLLFEYTRDNLHDPSYTLPRQYDNPSAVHYHSVAGFLGVYGNISTATLIHGCVMAMRHDNLDECNVAGDDGLEVTADTASSMETVRTMGEAHMGKTYTSSEGGCIHLKRPIRQLGNRLIHGDLISWPSLEVIQEIADPRYPYLRELTKRERRDNIASALTDFLKQISTIVLDESEIDIVDRFITRIYSEQNLPLSGNVPQTSHKSLGFVSAYERRFIGLDPIRNTLERNYGGFVRLPRRGQCDWEYDMFSGTKFACNQTSLLKHLVTLGYLEQEKVSSYVFGQEGLDQLLKEFTDPDRDVYDYTITRNLPTWVQDFESNS
jgi:hypothetical protein